MPCVAEKGLGALLGFGGMLNAVGVVDANAIDLACVFVDAGIGAVGACQFARDGGNVRSGSDACHKVEGC